MTLSYIGLMHFDTFAYTPNIFCCPKEGFFVDIYLFSNSSLKWNLMKEMCGLPSQYDSGTLLQGWLFRK